MVQPILIIVDYLWLLRRIKRRMKKMKKMKAFKIKKWMNILWVLILNSCGIPRKLLFFDGVLGIIIVKAEYFF